MMQICILGSNMEDVYKVVPKECLPVEYLPDDYTGPNAGTIQSMIGIYVFFSIAIIHIIFL